MSTVLIIDDSKSARKWILALLMQELHIAADYVEAGSGAEALTLLGEKNFDLVFLDLTMPGMSGFDVLAEMQQRQVTAKIVVVSADIQPKARELARGLGAAAFIEKPLHVDALRSVLTALGVLHV